MRRPSDSALRRPWVPFTLIGLGIHVHTGPAGPEVPNLHVAPGVDRFPFPLTFRPIRLNLVKSGFLGRMKNQFKTLRASSLYCQRCKVARPVRERLLLVLPDRELYDYLCTECGSSVGSREVKAAASDRPSLII
jgi:hypothetical protein